MMNIRIDFISDGPGTVVRISGYLASTAVPQLKKACDSLGSPFEIDLSNLLFADDRGINAIQAMADKGTQIHGASPFIQLLLDNAPNCKAGGKESEPS